MHEGIQIEVISTTRFDENSGLSMKYLGRTDTTRISKIKDEERFPISEQGYTLGKLLDGTEWIQELANHLCPSLIYTANPYIPYQNLHKNTENSSRKWTIFSVLFIIPIIIDIHGHRFEIYTLVS